MKLNKYDPKKWNLDSFNIYVGRYNRQTHPAFWQMILPRASLVALPNTLTWTCVKTLKLLYWCYWPEFGSHQPYICKLFFKFYIFNRNSGAWSWGGYGGRTNLLQWLHGSSVINTTSSGQTFTVLEWDRGFPLARGTLTSDLWAVRENTFPGGFDWVLIKPGELRTDWLIWASNWIITLSSINMWHNHTHTLLIGIGVPLLCFNPIT